MEKFVGKITYGFISIRNYVRIWICW